MYCKNCGKQLENTVSFCPYCGTKQSDTPTENQQQTTYTPYTNQQQYYAPQPDRQMYVQPVNAPMANPSQAKKNWALGISIATIPVLFIIRMLALEEREINGYTWKGPTYEYFVPDNIKTIMFILLLASMVFSIGFGVGGKPKSVVKSIVITIMSLLNMFVGYFIILG